MRHLKSISVKPVVAQDGLPFSALLAAINTIIEAIIDIVGALEEVIPAKQN